MSMQITSPSSSASHSLFHYSEREKKYIERRMLGKNKSTRSRKKSAYKMTFPCRCKTYCKLGQTRQQQKRTRTKSKRARETEMQRKNKAEKKIISKLNNKIDVY